MTLYIIIMCCFRQFDFHGLINYHKIKPSNNFSLVYTFGPRLPGLLLPMFLATPYDSIALKLLFIRMLPMLLVLLWVQWEEVSTILSI